MRWIPEFRRLGADIPSPCPEGEAACADVIAHAMHVRFCAAIEQVEHRGRPPDHCPRPRGERGHARRAPPRRPGGAAPLFTRTMSQQRTTRSFKIERRQRNRREVEQSVIPRDQVFE